MWKSIRSMLAELDLCDSRARRFLVCQLIGKWVRVEQEAEDCSWRIALVVLSFSCSLNLEIKRKYYKMQLNMMFLFIAYLFLI